MSCSRRFGRHGNAHPNLNGVTSVGVIRFQAMPIAAFSMIVSALIGWDWKGRKRVVLRRVSQNSAGFGQIKSLESIV